jgi:hypothetical protein
MHRGPSKRHENQVDGENRVGTVSDPLFSLLPPVHQRVSRFSNRNLEVIVDTFLTVQNWVGNLTVRGADWKPGGMQHDADT